MLSDDILLALPPSLLPVALARFEPSPEERREAGDAAVVYDGDSGTDHPPYRFFYPSSGPSSYVYPGEPPQAAEGTSSFTVHGDLAYLSNAQQAHQRTAPAHRNGVWPMPAYAMAAYEDTDATSSALAAADLHQRVPVSHDRQPYGGHVLPAQNVSYRRPMEHDMQASSSMRGAHPLPQLPHMMGAAEGGYGDLPYVKVENNDDITPSQVLWSDAGHYSAPHVIRRYPGSLEGYQPHGPLADATSHWRRWGGRCVSGCSFLQPELTVQW